MIYLGPLFFDAKVAVLVVDMATNSDRMDHVYH